MDLDQLQQDWDRLGRDGSHPSGQPAGAGSDSTGRGLDPAEHAADTDLQRLLEERAQRARAPLRRMKRTATRQALAMLLVFGLAYTQIAPPFRLSVAVLYGVIIALFATYYLLQYRLLSNVEKVEVSAATTSYIRIRLKRLKGLLLFYQIASLVILPATAAFLLWVRWTSQRLDFYDSPGLHLHPGQEGMVILCWSIPTLILMIFAYLVTRYQIRRSYGRQVEILQNDLDELQ